MKRSALSTASHNLQSMWWNGFVLANVGNTACVAVAFTK